ncbi:MAG: tetratricopeptide repeat protein, partial [Alphaproteobacteria bacterium]|nr:tetratricopeptide repeat protein [Alphaproteobacteria bacterium]
IQTVSHTQIMLLTDLSLMMLRFGQVISDGANADALNYYLGQYYSFNNGNYKESFNKVSKTHPLYLFGQMKIAEKNKDIKAIKKIAETNPLFVPATNVITNYYIRNGEKRAALRILNRALKQKNLTDTARIYFLKKRANVYLMFNEPKKAEKDVDAVMEIDDRLLNDILMLRARIWVGLNKNLTEANAFAMMLVQRNTSSVPAWDLLGMVVEKNEGVDAALTVLKRVGEISSNTSSLYEHLGDLYMKKGDKEKARASYLRAIELSDDGLVVLPYVQKKLRKAK